MAPFIADDFDTARHLDHITVKVPKSRARYASDTSQDSLQDDWTQGLTRMPTRCQEAAVALVGTLIDHCSTSRLAEVTRMFWEIASAHSICPELDYSVTEFATLAGDNSVHAYAGPWPPWGWGSTTPLRAPGQPRPSYSPPRVTSSRCAPLSCGTATRAA